MQLSLAENNQALEINLVSELGGRKFIEIYPAKASMMKFIIKAELKRVSCMDLMFFIYIVL